MSKSKNKKSELVDSIDFVGKHLNEVATSGERIAEKEIREARGDIEYTEFKMKIPIPEAKSIIIKPPDHLKHLGGEFWKERLKGKTLKAGEKVEVLCLGHKILVEVVSTTPKNTRVEVTEKTNILTTGVTLDRILADIEFLYEVGFISEEQKESLTSIILRKSELPKHSAPFPIKIGKNYRITIPKEWVELLRLKEGEIVWLVISREP